MSLPYMCIGNGFNQLGMTEDSHIEQALVCNKHITQYALRHFAIRSRCDLYIEFHSFVIYNYICGSHR